METFFIPKVSKHYFSEIIYNLLITNNKKGNFL
jgi:hypothetical protein